MQSKALFAPEPKTINSSKVLSGSGESILLWLELQLPEGMQLQPTAGWQQPCVGNLWLREVLACGSIAYLHLIFSHSSKLRYNPSTPSYRDIGMEVIFQQKPFWTTKISPSKSFPGSWKFLSLHWVLTLSLHHWFGCIPNARSNLNDKLLSIVTATLISSGLWALSLETAVGQLELLLCGDLSQ